MSDLQTRFLEIARTQCLPHLLGSPLFADRLDSLSFVLVGSVANGLCTADSDIDIAILCDEALLSEIGADMPWSRGRPSEAQLAGTQLHYYAISYQTVQAKLRSLDDAYIYNYGNMLVLRSPDSHYRRLEGLLPPAEPVRAERLEGKLDMLLRRVRALKGTIKLGDLMVIARVCLETITLCLKTTALLDGVPFDPRKRLFDTSLVGMLGQEIEPRMRALISDLGYLGCCSRPMDFEEFAFVRDLEMVVGILAQEAAKQGFRVGLAKADHRHAEP